MCFPIPHISVLGTARLHTGFLCACRSVQSFPCGYESLPTRLCTNPCLCPSAAYFRTIHSSAPSHAFAYRCCTTFGTELCMQMAISTDRRVQEGRERHRSVLTPKAFADSFPPHRRDNTNVLSTLILEMLLSYTPHSIWRVI